MRDVTPEDLLKLRRHLEAIRTGLEDLRDAIHENSRNMVAAAQNHKTLNAIVAYEEKTAANTATEANRQYSIQRSVRNWTRAAVIAAIIYAAIAAFQWCEMRRATDNAQEAFRLDERAWVEIEPVHGTLLTPAEGKFGAAFTYEIYPKNVGKTVASSVRLSASPPMAGSINMGKDADAISSIQDKLLSYDKIHDNGGHAPDFPISQPIPKVLAPNTVSPVPFTISGQEPQILKKDEWVSYIIGRIDYTDAFQVQHWRKFCFFVANGRGELWNCQEGNDEDRSPEKPPKK